MWEEIAWIILGIVCGLVGGASWYLRSRGKLRKGLKFGREAFDVIDSILDGTESTSEDGVKMSVTEKEHAKQQIAEAKQAFNDLLKD